MSSGMMTFLVATGAATAWLLLMRRSQNRRVRRPSGASDAGGYASDSGGWSLAGWVTPVIPRMAAADGTAAMAIAEVATAAEVAMAEEGTDAV
jgi:hypothetical protein